MTRNQDNNPDDWDFGPSEHYLPGSDLEVGDKIIFRIVDVEWTMVTDDEHPDWGEKCQYLIDVLASTNEKIETRVYTWNTKCRAARKLFLNLIEWDANRGRTGQNMEDLPTFLIVMEENGVRIRVETKTETATTIRLNEKEFRNKKI